MLSALEADSLNTLYAGVDTSISFSAGSNAYVISDPASPTGRRQIHEGEYLLLSIPQDSITCRDWGTKKPIPARYVLDALEVSQIRAAVSSYNIVIRSLAALQTWAVADMHAIFEDIAHGMLFNGVYYSDTYLYGQTFSTDGFYPSQRGYAIIANGVIKAINEFYSAKLPRVDANDYEGVTFP